jgi:methylmalonyl-CoA mutase C-terminal domain/subunit
MIILTILTGCSNRRYKGKGMKNSRVLIGILGLDQHEVGAVAVARMLRDAGMEVVYAGRFNLPAMIVQTALQEDVDVIGLSLHSWEHIYYLPELLGLLGKREVAIPLIVGGSIITKADEAGLKKIGIAAVFGPSATRQGIIDSITALSDEYRDLRNKNHG